MEHIKHIIDSFSFEGELVDCNVFGNGYINSTYMAVFSCNSEERRYIIQKVNTTVFKSVDNLMENIFSVTSFLRDKIKEAGGDPDRETLNYIKTRDGKLYCRLDNGDCYRAYRFVDNSKCYDTVENALLFKKSGEAFGKLQRYLSDFSADILYDIIPNFHNTIWRFENEFLPSIERDSMGRVAECAPEIEFIKARRNDCSRLVDLYNAGKLPLRVTHNDTKLNNVLFDNDSDEAICVIDLDTVMSGLALYDFGDSIRYGANNHAEDYDKYDEVKINLEYFKAYAEGFLSQAGSSLNDCELDNLAFSAKLMTLECGMRFLTDYLNGDTYFKTTFDKQNLVRARNQLALVADMELHMEEMENIIKAI